MTSASLQRVLRESLDHYQNGHRHRLTPRQWQVCRHILACRTEALGGFCLDCDRCGQTQPYYFACCNRHCPRCQRRASADWCERRRAAVLPVTYHHLVVTLPHALNPWVHLHPEVIYGLLCETVWATLSTFAADPKRFDDQLGMTAVLHTWGQTLSQHVHLHCLIRGAPFLPKANGIPPRALTCFRSGRCRATSAVALLAVCARRSRTANSHALRTPNRLTGCSISSWRPIGWSTPSLVSPKPKP